MSHVRRILWDRSVAVQDISSEVKLCHSRAQVCRTMGGGVKGEGFHGNREGKKYRLSMCYSKILFGIFIEIISKILEAGDNKYIKLAGDKNSTRPLLITSEI